MTTLLNTKLPTLVFTALLCVGCGSGSNTESKVVITPPTQTAPSCTELNSILIVAANDDGSHDGHGPAYAIDGNLTNESRWSSEGIGKAITFDLGQTSSVRALNVQWYQGNLRAFSFNVDTSTNNTEWTSALGNGVSSGTSASLENVELTDTQARYVRITGLGNSISSWNSIIEVQILGCGKPAPELEIPNEVPTESNFDISLWDNEGGDPRIGDELVFDALKAQYVSPNGSGWRHELKIRKDQRVAMTAVYEDFQANIKALLSVGSKLIVAQHHGGDTGTIVKLYIADSRESGFIDSSANNGIFDVYVRLAKEDGTGEIKKALGTIQSGDDFDLRIINNFGYVTVSAFEQTISLNVADSAGAYFKFGNYLQAQDAATLTNVKNSSEWAQFYQDAGITLSEVIFSRVNYIRQYE
jgi:hypothetical protein